MSQPTLAAVQTLAGLIAEFGVAMLTTVAPDGTLHSRPMMAQKIPFDGELWFLTSARSQTAAQVRRPPGCAESPAGSAVNLSYADPEQDRYISVSGSAEVVHDPEKVRQLWRNSYLAWFPKGKADPQIALVRVRVEEAGYWDASRSAMIRIEGFPGRAVNEAQGCDRQVSLEPGTLRFSDEPKRTA